MRVRRSECVCAPPGKRPLNLAAGVGLRSEWLCSLRDQRSLNGALF